MDVPGGGQQSRGPAEGVERRLGIADLAAVALPPRDRDDELQSKRIGETGEVLHLLPIRPQRARQARGEPSVLQVRAERAQLETVPVAQCTL